MNKLTQLHNLLEGYPSALVAFSGGVDSTFLLRIAKDVLGPRVTAVTADSPSFPAAELQAARELGDQMGVEHLIIQSHEMEREGYRENNGKRCFFCKTDLFERLTLLAQERQVDDILEGSNFDDLSDYRPGRKAAENFKIKSPLKDAGLTKREIREFSREMGLPTWDKPSFACLGSRIPHGQGITLKKLSQVEKAEDLLRTLPLRQFRVRHHGETARIEVLPEDFPVILKHHERIAEQFKTFGFTYTSLDLKGYRTGSMNEGLSWTKNVS